MNFQPPRLPNPARSIGAPGAAPGPAPYNGGPQVMPNPYGNVSSFSGDPAMQAIMKDMPGYVSEIGADGKLGSTFSGTTQATLPYNAGTWANEGAFGAYALGPEYAKAVTGAEDLNALAHSAGLTPYAQAQSAALGQQTQQSLGNVSAAAQGASGQAMDALATTGGLASGARENVALQGQRNALNAAQGVYGQQTAGNLAIGANDAQFKQGLLQGMPGMFSSLGGQAANAGVPIASGITGSNTFDASQGGINSRFDATQAGNSVYGENAFNLPAWQTGAGVYGSSVVGGAQADAANQPDKGLLGHGGFGGSGIGTSGGFFGSGLGSNNFAGMGNLFPMVAPTIPGAGNSNPYQQAQSWF